MHELSLCESIVEMLQDKATAESFRQVKRIYIEIGKLSCVEVHALRFAFDTVARQTVVEGAELEIDEISGRAWCATCSREVEVEQRHDACPNCQAYPLELRSGDEMRIKYVEVL